MQCKICDSKTKISFNSLVLKKYSVDYFHCSNCGFLQTEEPYWLNEAYESAINLSDTGLIERNLSFSKALSVFIYFNFKKDAKFLDYAGGYGIFTRLMRDIGFDFYWHDPHTKNLLAKGFEIDIKSKDVYELITAFEVFEHLINPKAEIEKMLLLTDTIMFSTQLIPDEVPDPNSWWYYGFEHGQHISFYSNKTCHWLAEHYKLNYYFVSGIHLLSKKRFNKNQLILMKKLKDFGLYLIVKKTMKSKTFTDHLMLRDPQLK